MKGYSHAITGGAIWTVAAAPTILLSDISSGLPNFPISPGGFLDVSPMTYGLGLMLTAGAALLPDIDHHNGTIAHSLPRIGPIPSPTQILCRFVGKISGGHRHGTHSILGIIAFVALAVLAGMWTMNIGGVDVAIGSGLFALFLTAFTLKVFKVGKKNSWFERWFISLVFAGMITWWFPNEWNVLPMIVALGCLAHCLGDMLTVGGVPWLYPYRPQPPKGIRNTPILNRMWQRNGWFALPILGKTDSHDTKGVTREKTLSFVLTIYILAVGIMTSFAYLGLGAVQ